MLQSVFGAHCPKSQRVSRIVVSPCESPSMRSIAALSTRSHGESEAPFEYRGSRRRWLRLLALAAKGVALERPRVDLQVQRARRISSCRQLSRAPFFRGSSACSPFSGSFFLFFWPSASPLGLRPPKSGRPAPNSPISSLSDCGFQPERTETARDLTKNPAVIEDTYTAVGTMQQLQDASRIIGLLRLWHDG